jgi:hypothetical protein
MGTNTKGYVITPVKDISHVMTIVERVISKLVAEAKPEKKGLLLPEGFSHPDTTLSPSSDLARTRFAIAGEDRTLTVLFGCDNDAAGRHQGDKLIFDMGMGGLSDKVITGVLAKMTHLGRCYFDANDCDSPRVDDVEIVEPPMTFLAAVLGRYTSALSVKSWIRMHALLPAAPALHEFLGITAEELAAYHAGASMYDICNAYKDTPRPASKATATA